MVALARFFALFVQAAARRRSATSLALLAKLAVAAAVQVVPGVAAAQAAVVIRDVTGSCEFRASSAAPWSVVSSGQTLAPGAELRCSRGGKLSFQFPRQQTLRLLESVRDREATYLIPEVPSQPEEPKSTRAGLVAASDPRLERELAMPGLRAHVRAEIEDLQRVVSAAQAVEREIDDLASRCANARVRSASAGLNRQCGDAELETLARRFASQTTTGQLHTLAGKVAFQSLLLGNLNTASVLSRCGEGKNDAQAIIVLNGTQRTPQSTVGQGATYGIERFGASLPLVTEVLKTAAALPTQSQVIATCVIIRPTETSNGVTPQTSAVAPFPKPNETVADGEK